jgi:hypothetical protein
MKNILQITSFVLLLVWQVSVNAQTYCAAGPSSTFDSEITNVAIIGDNFGISNLLTCPGVTGVQDFTATDSVDLSQGTSYTLFITFGTCGGIYTSAGEAWIDFNNDGDFTDAGESIGTWTGSPEPQNSTTYNATFNFSVPTGATLGETRMRIMHWEGGSLPLNSCGTFTWGAVEDYKVVVTNTPPPCPIPGSITSTPAATSATINWISTGTLFDIEYGPIGFTVGTGTSTTSTTTSVTLSNLTANTGYDVYVRNNCTASGNGQSGWSFAHTFFTTCAAVSTYPYLENFDGPSWVVGAPGTINQCWSRDQATIAPRWQVNSGGTGSFNTGPAQANSGSNYMYVETSAGTSNPTFLTAIEFDLTPLNVPWFSFYYHMFGAAMGDLIVEVSVDTGNTWTPILTLSGPDQTADTDPWKQEFVDLSNYKTAFTMIRFNGIRGTSFTSDMAIDDVRIEEAPPCPQPTGLSAGQITASSAAISWQSSGSSFVLEYGPAGFTQGTGMLDTVASSTALITGLTANTAYDVYVLNDCSGSGNGISTWVGPVSFTTLCGAVSSYPFTENFDGASWATGFPGTIDPCWNRDQVTTDPRWIVTSGATTFAQTGPDQANSLPNYVYLESSGGLQGNTSYLTLPAFDLSSLNVPLFSFNYHMYGAGMGDLVVEVSVDTGATWTTALTKSGQDQTAKTDPFNLEFVDLSTFKTSYTLIRLAGIKGTSTTGDIAVDDVKIEEAPPCPQPTALSVSNITASSADISWLSNGTTFVIEYGPTGYIQGTGILDTVSASPATLSGLAANTTYDVYILNDCSAAGNGLSVWSGPVTFSTLCSIFSMPYTEDFATWPPSCFTLTGTAGWNWEQHPSGHAQARFWNFSTGTATMTTPLIAITQEAQLKFKWAHLYSSVYPNDQLIVRAQVSGSSQWDTLVDFIGPTFNNPNSANTAPPSSLADFTQELIYLDSATYVGNNAIIEFIAITDFGPNLYVDDVEIEAVPLCPEPTQLSVSNITATSAQLSWQSSGSSFVIEYGPAGYTQGTGILDTVSGSPAVLTGLAANSSYDVYVLNDCSAAGNGISVWVGPLTFATLCGGVSTYPYTENFDGASWITGFPGTVDQCWSRDQTTSVPRWQVNTGGTSSLNTGPDQANSLSNYVYLETSGGSLGSTSYLSLPAVDLTSLTVPWFTFYYHMFGATMGDLIVEVSIDTGATWTAVLTLTGQDQTASNDPWKQASVNLSAYNTANTLIRFAGVRGSSFTSDMSIDDVRIEEAPSCPAPTALGASNFTPTSVDLSWTSGGATNWNIEYGPVGFVQGTGAGTIISNVTNPYTLSGLTASTCYDFYVQDSCGIGDVSAWAGPFTFCTACGVIASYPYSENFDGASWVTGIPGTIDQCWSRDQTIAVPRWQVNSGGTSSFGTGPNQANSLSNYVYLETSGGALGDTSYFTLPSLDLTALNNPWFTFYYHMYGASMGDLVVEVSTDTGNTWTAVLTLSGPDQTAETDPWKQGSVALTAYKTANTLIRFAGVRGSSFTSDMSIDDIKMEEGPTCPAPTALNAVSFTATSAELSWTSGGANNWNIEYGPVGFTQGTGAGTIVNNVTNPYTLTGLSANTCYDYYVQDSCGVGDVSQWSGPFTFCTPTCDTSQQCAYTIYMYDSFGDGWNGFEVEISVGGNQQLVLGQSFTGGFSATENFSACNGLLHDAVVLAVGSWPTEVSFDIVDYNGDTVVVGQNFASTSQGSTVGSFVPLCQSACVPPTNFGTTSIACDNAVVSWNSDPATILSGVLYGPAGFNPQTGGTLILPATSPLTISGLSPGTGYDMYLTDSCAAGLSIPDLLSVTTPSGPQPGIAFSVNQVNTTATTADVEFDATASSNYTSLTWDFGGGNTSTNVVATNTYTMNQTYSVTLTLTNGCGQVDSTFDVTVAGIGIDESNLARSLNIFPNPSAGSFAVDFDLQSSEGVTINVLDPIGQLVARQELGVVQGAQHLTFDLESQASGVYLVQIVTDSGTLTRRITIRSK